MDKSQKSHVRQHYIPQFILKNFSYDKDKVFFFEKGEDEYSTIFVSDIFMEKYLYSKEEGQLEIEESLARFEADVAPIFKKINTEDEISLTREEYDHLRVFLYLLTFRTVNTRDQFNNMSDKYIKLYGATSAAEMKDFWLKNVHLISQCRCFNDVFANPEINDMIKRLIEHEYFGFYMCILERKGGIDFHITDCYPAVVNGETDTPNGKTLKVPLYYIFPLSDSRVITLVTNHIECVPWDVAYFDCKKTLKRPKDSLDMTHLIFRPSKIGVRDVEWINEMMIRSAIIGTVVKDITKCSQYL